MDENDQVESWANMLLKFIDYSKKPDWLQSIIKYIYVEAISQIHIEGSEVIPVPLFEKLDGKTTADYVDRVEPSDQGGKKIAELLYAKLSAPPEKSQC